MSAKKAPASPASARRWPSARQAQEGTNQVTNQEVANHISHPFKVEGRNWIGNRFILVGRAMFRQQEEAIAYSRGTGEDGEDLPVLKSKPGDVEFA